MFRYMMLMWNAACPDRSAVAHEMRRTIEETGSNWSVALEGAGLMVLVADKSRYLSAHPLHGAGGVVLGEIFPRQTYIQCDAAVKPAVFDEHATREVVLSQGRRLTSHYWGNYVAVVVDAGSRTKFVLNDPTGTLPCYFSEYRGVRVVFSCLSDCRDLKFMRFSINWTFVRARTLNGIFDVETNPFAEISGVHRGECVRFDDTGGCTSRSFYWHPSRFPDAGNLIDDSEEAERALRATVRSCVHSLAAQHSSVLQQISGGLDSSIVLGCLGDAPSKPEITCVTQYVPGHACDERRWARHATLRGGYRHVDVCLDPAELIFERLAPLAASVEPGSAFMHWQRGPAERRLAAECRATGTFTGENGDATFCSTSYPLAVDHSLRRHGFGGRTLRIAALVAARRDHTVWNVLAKSLRRQVFGTRMKEHRVRLATGSQLVSLEVAKSGEYQDHFPNPWFSSSGRIPLESIWRLGSLAFAPSFYDLSVSHRSAAPYSVSPLCAQPVYEIARRIPVDIHFDGGRIRGLARQAFTHEVPEPILRRQWKDRPLLQVAEVVQRNLSFIREALLDGAMTRERILDRAAVELALREGPTKSRAMSSEILRHLDLELWIRHGL